MTRKFGKSVVSWFVYCAVSVFLYSQDGSCESPPDTPHIEAVISFTNKPAEKPLPMSMLADDDRITHMVFQPTIPPTEQTVTTTTKAEVTAETNNSTASEEPKGRALNFTLEENSHENVLSTNVSTFDKFGDLSDVSMDKDDEEDFMPSAKILIPKITESKNISKSCEKGGLTYDHGVKLENGCDSICTCNNGKMECADRCTGPFFRKGKKIEDPLCAEKNSEDPCCSILVCAADTETEPLEICTFKNKTYNRGDQIENRCDELCTCGVAGKVTCKNRCPPIDKVPDRCLVVPDEKDPCCKTVRCDVTLDDVDQEHDKDMHEITKYKIISAKYINETAIKINFEDEIMTNSYTPTIEISNDKINWKPNKLTPNKLILVDKKDIRFVRLEQSDETIVVDNTMAKKKQEIQSADPPGCTFKGGSYKIGEEFHDGCESYCVCQESGVNCLKFECPTYFGLDTLNPACIKWDTVPTNFTAVAPNCCPEKVVCINNGSCEYEGVIYQNWQQLPENVTGCEKRCYCEMNKIECQNACPPVTALPSPHLNCNKPMIGHTDDDCCPSWMCDPRFENEPHGSRLNQSVEMHYNDTIISMHPTTTKDNYSTSIENIGSSENKVNITEKEMEYLGPFGFKPTKKPSKILGPLLVYTNKDNASIINSNTQMINEGPSTAHDENHYFTKDNTNVEYDHSKDESIVMSKPVDTPTYFSGPSKDNSVSKKTSNKKQYKEESDNPEYLGPFNPDFKLPHIPNKSVTATKPSKGTEKIKPNKNIGMFVTPPSHFNENYIPEYQNAGIQFNHAEDYSTNQNTNNKYTPNQLPHQIQIHGQGNPEDILQIINQHPELANYPPGSVLEIHNVPHTNGQTPAFHNPNAIGPNKERQPANPYLYNQEQQPGLPHGVHLDHILQEIQKNSPQGNSYIPFPTPQHFPAHDGHIFVAQPNGPVFNTRPQQNLTQTGISPGLFPQGIPNIPPYYQQQDEIVVHDLQALDAHTIRLAFTVPPVIVGLHGRVEVRYTNKASDDTNTWKLQVFAPPNDLIPTPQLEFDLIDLEPDTEYKIKIAITLRDLHTSPSSRVYTIRTLKPTSTSTLPPNINIDPDLVITEINATWVNVAWRKFNDFEMQFIDGVQLRFREIDGKVYSATPLIHRAVTNYLLENLKPTTKYEIGIFFIPFPGQTTELRAEHMIHFTTANTVDTYGFNVTLEISHIKPTSVEIAWSGVPYPEDKYVNIYRAIYQSDSGKGDSSTFKVAKRDSPPKTIVTDLKPGTRYRLWLEVYLTNGKIKTSNVQDFLTKPRSLPNIGASSKSDKLEGEFPDDREDYYGPLVVVAILAAIAVMTTIVLLLMLVRRHSQNKAAITTPPSRVSQSAYDNPTYKVEIQQETMNL